jgi:hypothetical protein
MDIGLTLCRSVRPAQMALCWLAASEPGQRRNALNAPNLPATFKERLRYPDARRKVQRGTGGAAAVGFFSGRERIDHPASNPPASLFNFARSPGFVPQRAPNEKR